MRKSTIKLLIITLALLCAGHCLFAQSQDTIPTVTTSLVYNDVKNVLTSMAEPIKNAAQYGFEALVKVSFWKGIGYLFSTVAATILFLVFGGKCFKYAGLSNSKFEDQYAFKSFICGIISAAMGVCTIWGITLLPEIAMRIGAPEYYAIQEIMNMIK